MKYPRFANNNAVKLADRLNNEKDINKLVDLKNRLSILNIKIKIIIAVKLSSNRL